MSTLSERLEIIAEKCNGTGDYLLKGKIFCQVCGLIRFSDSTGLTCGKLECLAGLGEAFIELEENCEASEAEAKDDREQLGTLRKHLWALADKLKIEFKETDDLEYILDKLEGPLARAKQVSEQLDELASILGVEREEGDQDLDLCFSLKRELMDVIRKIDLIEKKIARPQ